MRSKCNFCVCEIKKINKFLNRFRFRSNNKMNSNVVHNYFTNHTHFEQFVVEYQTMAMECGGMFSTLQWNILTRFTRWKFDSLEILEIRFHSFNPHSLFLFSPSFHPAHLSTTLSPSLSIPLSSALSPGVSHDFSLGLSPFCSWREREKEEFTAFTK